MKRIFAPGSEWLYFKIYAGSYTIDNILCNEIIPLVKRLEEEKIIDKWFFIRYQDPDFHLRIRFHVKGDESLGLVISSVYKKLKSFLSSRLIFSICVDTYVREMERYGSKTMILSEKFFCVDSYYVCRILNKLEHIKATDKDRLLLGIVSIDSYLNAFGYSLSDKKNLLCLLDNNFREEFGYNKNNMKQLNMMYRKVQDDIMNIISKNEKSNRYKGCLSLVKKREGEIEKIANEFKKKSLKQSIDKLMPSYIHMMENRLFRSKNRIYEMLVYNFLCRFYLSVIAQTSKNSSNFVYANR